MVEKVYTLPPKTKYQENYLATANEWVAIPTIREQDGSMGGVNCTSLWAKGLIEFRGAKDKPFLTPVLLVDGTAWQGNLTWKKEFQWIPRFTGNQGKGTWGGTILTPKDERGWYYRLWAANNGAAPVEVKLGWEISWGVTVQLIYHDHLLGCVNRIAGFDWTGALVLEARGLTGVAAMAFYLKDEGLNQVQFTAREEANGQGEHLLFVGGVHRVQPGQVLELDLVAGLNVEADGAAATVVHLKRLGYTRCYNQTVAWLGSQAEKVLAKNKPAEKVEKGKDKMGGIVACVEEIILRNLFFNYFFTSSRTVDTNELVLLTSRSGRYYVSGAFWARDAFLWSFPAVLLIDQEQALAMLQAGLTRYVANGSFHSCYVDGTLLYPGFELDELAAFLLALNAYDQAYGDFPWAEEWVLAGAKKLEKVLWQHHNPKLYLFSTFLDPSDDQVEYPYLTYANVLAWQAIFVLRHIYREHNDQSHGRYLDGAGRLLKKAVNQHCIVPGPLGQMYAWAVDGEGNYQLYDNPAGSLQLLPHYQFCSPKDKVWLNTLNWIYSEHNPYAYLDTPVKGIGGVHAPAPWVLGVCNSLLAGRVREGLAQLRDSSMDNGYACETVDLTTGRVNTGAAFAPCAGFLAYCLVKLVREQGWQPFENFF